MSPLQLAAVCAVAGVALLAATGRLAFLRAEFPTPWRRAVAAVLLVVILTVVVFYPVAAGSRAADPDVDAIWFPALFAGHATLVLFLAGWWALQSRSAASFLALQRDHIVDDVRDGIRLGLSGWAITIVVTMIVAAAALAAGVGPAPPQEIPPLMIWLAELPVAQKLVIVAAAMTVEEAFFRAFLQRRLGLVLSSGLFAAAHASYGLPFMIVSVFTISLVIGRGLQQRGRLLPCIVAHGLFDGIQLLVILPWAIRMIDNSA